MIDFPITELFDDSLCLVWLERHLHPNGFVCPQCGSDNRRHFRIQGYYAAYRCRVCAKYYTLLSGTAFEGSRQRPATAPTGLMEGQTFEVDELYQNAGEKKYAASRSGRPAASSRE